jgi:DNA-directed RNA polymerase specialized sigma24 family protein
MDYGRQLATQITGNLPEPASDRAPIDGARGGDNTAQQLLYRMYKESALSRAQRVGVQPKDAEQSAAEAFLRMLSRMRHGGGPDFSLAPYLFAVARQLSPGAHPG